MTCTSALPTRSMSDVVLINVHAFCFASTPYSHHPIHPNQIPRERVQATRHEPNAVDELQLSFNLLHLTQKGLIFINRGVGVEADVLLFVLSNDTNGSRIELFPQFSDQGMPVVTT